MKIIESLDELKEIALDRSVCTMGVFDGVHIGHQHILKISVKQAKLLQCKSVVVSFKNLPEHVLEEQEHDMLTKYPQKLELINELELDMGIILQFTRELAQISPENWIENIIYRHLHPKLIVIGEDFKFGKGSVGTIELLGKYEEKFNYNVLIIPPVKYSGNKVSSTIIREILKRGDIQKANELLGRMYEVEGEVVKGKGTGRHLGFPTINILENKQLLPAEGVYAVQAKVDGNSYKGAAFIGKSHYYESGNLILEVFLIDFPGYDLYGYIVEVLFIKRLRGIIKFDTSMDLKKQIHSDIEKVKQISL